MGFFGFGKKNKKKEQQQNPPGRYNICSHNTTRLVGDNTLNLGQNGSTGNSHYHE